MRRRSEDAKMPDKRPNVRFVAHARVLAVRAVPYRQLFASSFRFPPSSRRGRVKSQPCCVKVFVFGNGNGDVTLIRCCTRRLLFAATPDIRQYIFFLSSTCRY